MLARFVSTKTGSRAFSAVVLQAQSTTEGLDYQLNWALAKSGVTPKEKAYRNLSAKGLSAHIKAGTPNCVVSRS